MTISLFLTALSMVWFTFRMAMFILFLFLNPLDTFIIIGLVLVVVVCRFSNVVSTTTTGPSSSSAAPPAPPSTPHPSLSSLIPSCSICLHSLKPPLKIFNCGNGHLICSSCQPKTNICFCKSKLKGKATAMEQMVGQILSIQQYLDKE